MNENPLSKNWEPYDKETIVSVRCPEVFGDNQVRRARVVGWHIGKISRVDERRDPFATIGEEPVLEYELLMLKTKAIHWVPVEAIIGSLRGVPNLED